MWPLNDHPPPHSTSQLTSDHAQFQLPFSAPHSPRYGNRVQLHPRSANRQSQSSRNRLLQATGLELADICDVPENCRLLLAPAARGRWHRHRIEPGNGNDAPEVICRLARFVVRAKERERTFIREVAVLHDLMDGGEGRLCRVGSSQRVGGEEGRPCEVSGKWARVDERGEEVKGWVEEVTELTSLAEGLLEWNGSTAVDLENDGAVRRRRTYGGGL